MRRPCKRPRRVGCFVIIAGVFILLAMMLPLEFWWFALGAALIFIGIWLLFQ